MKAAIVALAALMGMTACNREAKQGGEGGAADTAMSATDKIKEEAREAGKEVGEATDKAVAKTKEETRQTARDVQEGAEKLTEKTEQGAKKTTETTKAEAGKLMPGDAAATAKRPAAGGQISARSSPPTRKSPRRRGTCASRPRTARWSWREP